MKIHVYFLHNESVKSISPTIKALASQLQEQLVPGSSKRIVLIVMQWVKSLEVYVCSPNVKSLELSHLYQHILKVMFYLTSWVYFTMIYDILVCAFVAVTARSSRIMTHFRVEPHLLSKYEGRSTYMESYICFSQSTFYFSLLCLEHW